MKLRPPSTTRLRYWLLLRGSWKWNAWVRDGTAWLERLGWPVSYEGEQSPFLVYPRDRYNESIPREGTQPIEPCEQVGFRFNDFRLTEGVTEYEVVGWNRRLQMFSCRVVNIQNNGLHTPPRRVRSGDIVEFDRHYVLEEWAGVTSSERPRTSPPTPKKGEEMIIPTGRLNAIRGTKPKVGLRLRIRKIVHDNLHGPRAYTDSRGPK